MTATEIIAYMNRLNERFKALPALTRDQAVAARDLAEEGAAIMDALADALTAIEAAQDALGITERPQLRLVPEEAS